MGMETVPGSRVLLIFERPAENASDFYLTEAAGPELQDILELDGKFFGVGSFPGTLMEKLRVSRLLPDSSVPADLLSEQDFCVRTGYAAPCWWRA